MTEQTFSWADDPAPEKPAPAQEAHTPERTQLVARAYEEFDDMPLFAEGSDAAISLLQGVLAYGFERPSVIQQRAIMVIADGHNVIGQSQSGTGKTGAFVIGALARINPTQRGVQVVFVAHTHELAQQIAAVVKEVGSRLLKPEAIELCVGQSVSVEQNIDRILTGDCSVIVGTPGRICDLVTRKIKGRSLIDPAGVCTLVLDEADKLMSPKFYPQIERITNALDSSREDNLQIAIFSATFSNESLEQARTLCVPGRFKYDWETDSRRPYEVLVPVEDLTLVGIEQYYYELQTTPKDSFTDKVIFITTLNEIRVIPQCIIYVNTQDAAQRLCDALCSQGLETKCIYGKMPPVERLRVSSEFRRGAIRVLVATDLLSRGFDVQQVSLVINFDLPNVVNNGAVDEECMAEYLHRIGRSGRFGRKGLAINIITGSRDKHRLEKIKTYYKVDIQPVCEDDIMNGMLY